MSYYNILTQQIIKFTPRLVVQTTMFSCGLFILNFIINPTSSNSEKLIRMCNRVGFGENYTGILLYHLMFGVVVGGVGGIVYGSLSGTCKILADKFASEQL